MKLYLTQHGEAFRKEEDPDRPLTDKGKSDIAKIAHLLKQINLSFDKIIHSGKLRAQQTAEIIHSALSSPIDIDSSGIINPHDDPKAFAWQDESWDRDMLVIGHLPFLGKLVSLLLIENENTSLVSFTPGSIICLNCDENKNWTIEWMLRPEMISHSL